MSKYDIKWYTHISLDGLLYPMCVDIALFRDTEYYSIAQKHVVKYDILKNTVEPSPTHFFYGKFKEDINIHHIISVLYEFIDHQNIKNINYPLPTDFLQFKDLCLSVSYESISNAYKELMYYISEVRNEFFKLAIKELGIDDPYPQVKAEKSYTSTQTYKQYKDKMSMPKGLIELQSYYKYNGVFFEENVGRAYMNYSWREKELRKMYVTAENNYDSFNESVKSKIMEELSK